MFGKKRPNWKDYRTIEGKENAAKSKWKKVSCLGIVYNSITAAEKALGRKLYDKLKSPTQTEYFYL